MYTRGSSAAFSVMWNSQQGDNFNRQIRSTKRFCIRGICWTWICSEFFAVEWIRIAWASTQGPKNPNCLSGFPFQHIKIHVLGFKLFLLIFFFKCAQVAAKRTNVPGMKQFRGRRPSPYLGFRSRRPYMAGPPMFPPYGYGYVSFFFLGRNL